MGEVVRVLTSELFSVLPHSRSPTVKLILEGDHGKAYQSHGAYFEFTATTLALAEYQVAAYATRIISKCASMNFREFGNDAIWEKILKELGIVNFHGNWHADLLQLFISRSRNLRSLCLTYLKCSDLPSVLDSISSKHIYEIVAHVGPGQHRRFVQKLADASAAKQFRLKRLMLIFSDPLKKGMVEDFQGILNKVLQNNSEAILLFGGENDCCIEDLKAAKYVEAGKMTMATNALYDDEDPIKEYDTYKCFRSEIGDRVYKIGSLVGSFTIPEAYAPFEDKEHFHEEVVEASPTFSITAALGRREYSHSPYLDLSAVQYHKRCDLEEYEGDVYRVGVHKCCETEKTFVKSRGSLFEFPGWDSTRIQKVIYHEFLTEYLTSTGLFFRLRSMKDEPDFYRSKYGNKRIVIDCRTHHRIKINVASFEYLLRNSNHVEFTGDWLIKLLQTIVSQMNPNIEKLTMMQISLQKRGDPIRLIFNFMHDDVKASIKCLHIDARDSPVDRSMGSLYNGLRNNFNNLDEFVAIVNHWTQPNYPCGFSKFIQDLIALVRAGGSSTIVVVNSTLPLANFVENRFNPNITPISVYPCYQRQGHINPSAPVDLNRPMDHCELMMQFYLWRDRHYYIAVPWDHEHARYVNNQALANDKKFGCITRGY